MTVTNPNWPLVTWQSAFNADPNDPAAVPTWNDLSARLRTWDSDFGRQYETDTNQAGEAEATLDDQDELLNPANTTSAYNSGSNKILPLRPYLHQAMWPPLPVGAAVNMLNATSGYDPTFDSYTVGSTPSWVAAAATTLTANVKVDNVSPHSGANDIFVNVLSGAAIQGAGFTVTCIPGQQYTASAYCRTSVSETVQISVSGGATGGSATVNSTYTRISVTFTATLQTHVIQVLTVGTVSASNLRIDDIQLEPGASTSTFSSAIGPVVYGVSAGNVERWPSTWDYNGIRGRCDIICVDGLAALAQLPLHTEYANSVMAKAPDFYWRLADGSTATTFADSSGNSASPLVPKASKFGAGGGVTAGTEMPIVGDPGATGVQFTSPALLPGQNSPGTILAAGSLAQSGTFTFPAAIGTSWSASTALWIVNTATTPASQSVLMLAGLPITNAGSGGDILYPIRLTIRATGQIEAAYSNLDSTGTFHTVNVLSAATGYDDGMPHLLTATVTQVNGGNTTITLTVDSLATVSTTVTTASLGGMLSQSANTIEVGGSSTRTMFDQLTNGPIGHLSLWNRALSPAEIADLWNAGGLGYAGELSGNRVARYLSYGYFGPTSIDAGQSTMGPGTCGEDTTVLDAIQFVTTSENGDFWCDQNGVAQFRSRTSRYLESVATWVLGENAAGGEAPYEQGILFDFDPTQIYNNVVVTRTGGIVATAVDAASQKSYFPREFDVEIGVLLDLEAVDAANWQLANHKQPKQRVSGVQLHPSANPALWPVVLGIRKNDRVTVKRRTAAGLVMSADYFVERLEHAHSPGDWLTSLELSPAPIQPWILGSSTFGSLGFTTILGY